MNRVVLTPLKKCDSNNQQAQCHGTVRPAVVTLLFFVLAIFAYPSSADIAMGKNFATWVGQSNFTPGLPSDIAGTIITDGTVGQLSRNNIASIDLMFNGDEYQIGSSTDTGLSPFLVSIGQYGGWDLSLLASSPIPAGYITIPKVADPSQFMFFTTGAIAFGPLDPTQPAPTPAPTNMFYTFSSPIVVGSVPEPPTFAMIGLGLLVMLEAHRIRRVS